MAGRTLEALSVELLLSSLAFNPTVEVGSIASEPTASNNSSSSPESFSCEDFSGAAGAGSDSLVVAGSGAPEDLISEASSEGSTITDTIPSATGAPVVGPTADSSFLERRLRVLWLIAFRRVELYLNNWSQGYPLASIPAVLRPTWEI